MFSRQFFVEWENLCYLGSLLLVRNTVAHSLVACHFGANWPFLARSNLLCSKNGPILCEVVKNAFSWGMQDWLISMQAIYQRF